MALLASSDVGVRRPALLKHRPPLISMGSIFARVLLLARQQRWIGFSEDDGLEQFAEGANSQAAKRASLPTR